MPTVPLGNAAVVMLRTAGGFEFETSAFEPLPPQPARIRAIAAENRLLKKEVLDPSTKPSSNKVRRHSNHEPELY